MPGEGVADIDLRDVMCAVVGIGIFCQQRPDGIDIAFGDSILRVGGIEEILQLLATGGVAKSHHVGEGLYLGVVGDNDIAAASEVDGIIAKRKHLHLLGDEAHIVGESAEGGGTVGEAVVVAVETGGEFYEAATSEEDGVVGDGEYLHLVRDVAGVIGELADIGRLVGQVVIVAIEI